MNLARDVRKAGCAEIAEEAQFPARGGFAGGNEVEPAIVVVIEGGESPAPLPSEIRQLDPLKPLAFDIAPQADAQRSGVGEGEVHPPVFIEIERDDADSRRKIFFCEIDAGQRREFSFPRIQVDRCALAAAGKNKIDGAIIVEIGSDEARAGGVDAKSRFSRNICERAVAVVAPENVVPLISGRGVAWLGSDVKVEVTVVIVIDEGDADAAWLTANAHGLRDVFKLAIAFLVQQVHTIAEANGEVRMAIVIKITRGAAEAAAF